MLMPALAVSFKSGPWYDHFKQMKLRLSQQKLTYCLEMAHPITSPCLPKNTRTAQEYVFVSGAMQAVFLGGFCQFPGLLPICTVSGCALVHHEELNLSLKL